MSEWQPIETAPKDGTKLILARYGYCNDPGDIEPSTAEWRQAIMDDNNRKYLLWWVTSGSWSQRWNNWNDGVEPAGLNDPTHWAPMFSLPEPPND